MKRTVIVLPGRGSYTKRARRSLPTEHAWVARADALRAEYGLPSLVELDHADRWKSSVQLRPDNVSPTIWLISMIDAHAAMQEHEAVAVAGNSMGWYTALAVAGVLSFDDGFRLVQEMALLQMEHKDGGQILYPLVDDQWRVDPRQVDRVQAVLASRDDVFESIRLGGFVVLAGTEDGVGAILDTLPGVEMGPSVFPVRLAQHGPYHTALLNAVAQKARAQLSRLPFRAPDVTLIDGTGRRHTPASADPVALRDYTLGDQITTLFDFTTSIRVAYREFAPDFLTLTGPGNTLGSICAHVAIANRVRKIESRHEFEAVQESDSPLLWSMRR